MFVKGLLVQVENLLTVSEPQASQIKGINKGTDHTHRVIIADERLKEEIEKAVFGDFWAGSALHMAVMIDCSQFGCNVLVFGGVFSQSDVCFLATPPRLASGWQGSVSSRFLFNDESYIKVS